MARRLVSLPRLGYVGTAYSLGDSPWKTCRLKNATPERLRALIGSNLAALADILRFNAAQGIAVYRVTSSLVPFASHPANQLAWWEEFGPQLADLGTTIRTHGMRVSMHPPQMTVLNAPSEPVVLAALADLVWHARFLDALGTDPSSKIVVHVGGVYGDPTAAMDRFCRVVNERVPPAVARRLVVENDDRLFHAEQALEVSARTGVPVVFDWFHHQVLPAPGNVTELMTRAFATWRPIDGPPKIHMSSQAPDGPPGAHADWVEADDFRALLRDAPAVPFDCMLEAKRKDLALLRLREALTRPARRAAAR